jgi:hypothetical protein
MAELAAALVARGHEVELAGTSEEYRSGPKGRGRLLREARALAGLFRAGIAARRPDVVFAGSSPPCLALVAARVAAWHRAPWVHWAMDLYPELAVALGELREGALPRWIGARMRAAYRRAAALVAVGEDMRRHFGAMGLRAESISPWVPAGTVPDGAAPAAGGDGVWLYSGNLGRAHEWRTLLGAQAILERRGVAATLRFQGSGASREAAMAEAGALGLRRCEWAGYAPADRLVPELLVAGALVATQREETLGLLWPSKLALMRSLPRPILWVGPPGGAVAGELRGIPGAGVFAPGDEEGVAGWVERALSGAIPAIEPLDARAAREATLERFAALLEGSGEGRPPGAP